MSYSCMENFFISLDAIKQKMQKSNKIEIPTKILKSSTTITHFHFTNQYSIVYYTLRPQLIKIS